MQNTFGHPPSSTSILVYSVVAPGEETVAYPVPTPFGWMQTKKLFQPELPLSMRKEAPLFQSRPQGLH